MRQRAEVLRHYASLQRLTLDDAEDCEITFLEHCWTRTLRRLCRDGPCPPALMHRCARNWVVGFVRRHAHLSAQEAQWLPEWVNCPAANGGDPHDCDEPETHLLLQELAARIEQTLARLTPNQQHLFHRHLAGETAQQLAAVTGRTPHAVEQALYTIRRRLQGLLARDGLTEADARGYVPHDSSSSVFPAFFRR